MTKLGRQAQDLYDLLAAVVPKGRYRNDLMDDLGLISSPMGEPTTTEITEFHKIKGHLQDILGATDVATMVGRPVAGDQGWIYSLQGDPVHKDSTKYMVTKMQNLFQRQYRAYMVMKALSAGINGATTEGRYIRKLQRAQFRTMEDTVDVLVELGAKAPTLPPPPPRYP